MIICDKDSLSKIIKNGFNSDRIKGASYELTASNEYFDLTENPSKKIIAKNEENKKILIKPLHKVVLITAEELELPANLIGRIVTKGSLFSIGLSAINTIADPGFKGRLGLVFYNFSSKYIVLDVGQEIAKIDFNQVRDECETYSGQHGFSLNHWPILTNLQYTYNEVKNHELMKSSSLDEAYEILPNSITDLLKKLQKGICALRIVLIILFTINLIACTLLFFNKIEGITAGLLINGITALIGFIFTFSKSKIF